MADTCEVCLLVEGTPEELRRWQHAARGVDVFGEPVALDFERHVPTDGRTDWDSCERAWGTREKPYGVEESGTVGDGWLEYRFETPWFAPGRWLEVAGAAHPTLSFMLSATVETVWTGEMTVNNGKVISEDLPSA